MLTATDEALRALDARTSAATGPPADRIRSWSAVDRSVRVNGEPTLDRPAKRADADRELRVVAE